MEPNDKPGILFIGVGSDLSLLAALICGWVPIIQTFFGPYIWILRILWGLSGALTIIGVEFHKRKKKIAEPLIFWGAVLGIGWNWISLIGLHKLYPSNDLRPRSWLTLPILLSYGCLVIFISLLEDRQHIPLNWFGRDGLDFTQTIWDTDVFWGEFWFNLMVGLVLFAVILFRYPILLKKKGLNPIWGLKVTQEGKIFRYSGIVFLSILVAMGITWNPSFSVLNNWYPTQFAYQLFQWPVLIAAIGLGSLFLPNIINIHTSKKKGKPVSYWLAWVGLLVFGGCWIYLTNITDFHLHALFNFEYNLHYFVFTFGIACILFYLVKKANLNHHNNSVDETEKLDEKDEISKNGKNGKKWNIKGKNETDLHKTSVQKLLYVRILWAVFFVLGVGFLLGTQFYAATTSPAIGADSLFGIELYWWWPVSHWPSYTAIISGVCFMVFGVRWVSRKYIQKSQSKENQKSAIPENIIPTGRPLNKGVIAGLLTGLLLMTLLPTSLVVGAQLSKDESPLLLVNQVGYYPNSPKQVVFQVPGNITFSGDLLVWISDENQDFVFSILLNESVQKYGYSYLTGDFSNLTTEGRYSLHTIYNGTTYSSYSFKIAEDIYDDMFEMALRFFYYQRCNYAVQEVIPGYLGHAACHMDDGMVWDGTQWVYHDLTGGWHDAGDYNKYNSWFQTQWYCTEAIAESIIRDPFGTISNFTNLYDSDLPDAVDEALWGAKFCINSVNDEAIGGEETRYLVWEALTGYRQSSERSARMSYWGPPEKDSTTPRHTEFNSANTTFMGFHRGYDIAATILKTARLIDTMQARYPGVEFPTWIETNTTYLRDLAGNVYEKYLEVQADAADDVQSAIGKFFYWDEMSYLTGNFTNVDGIITDFLDDITTLSSYPLWFGWAGYYLWGHILDHYLNHNRTIPEIVHQKIVSIQGQNFAEMFDAPFHVKHVRQDDQNVLFYGAERQTDMQTNVWIEALMCVANSTTARPELVQAYLDWLLGVNPMGISLMEGVGQKNIPQYHHRYSNAENPGGEVPGAIPNGISLVHPTTEYMETRGIEYTDLNILRTIGDHPWIADWPENPLQKDGVPSNPNEVWIPHDAMMLRILTVVYEYQFFN